MKISKTLLIRGMILSLIVSLFSNFPFFTTLQADGLDVNQAIAQIISPITNDSYHYSFAGGDNFDTILTGDNPAVFYSFGLDCTAGSLAIVSKAIRNGGGDPYLYFGECRNYLNKVYPWDLAQHFTNMTLVQDTGSLLPGDILVFGSSGQKGHMSVYAGNGQTFDFGDQQNGNLNNYAGLANYLSYQSSVTNTGQSYGLTAVYRAAYEKTLTYQVTYSPVSPSVSLNNQMYPLSQASFGIYTDPSCTDASLLEVITTDANGIAEGSHVVDVNIKTVYMKQLTPFTNTSFTDTSIHECTLENNSASFVISEEPLYSNAQLTFTMQDAEDRKNASVQTEAQFTIEYYDTLGDISGLTPFRTWVIETQEERSWNNVTHLARLDRAHLVSGELFTNAIGATVLPIGTIVIKETKASTKYSLSGSFCDQEEITASDTIQLQIVNENGKAVLKDGNEIAALSYVKEEVPIRGSFQLQKADAALFDAFGKVYSQGDASFAYAEFDLYYLGDENDQNASIKLDRDGDGIGEGEEYLPSDTKPIYHFVLDEKGSYTCPNTTFLSYGNYKLVETKASKGYSVIDQDTGKPLEIRFAIQNEKEAVQLYAKETIIQSDIEISNLAEGAVFDIVLKRHVYQSRQSDTAVTKQDVLQAYAQREEMKCTDLSGNENTGFTQMEYDEIRAGADGIAKSKKLAFGEYFMVQADGDNEEVISFSIYEENRSTLSFTASDNSRYILKMFKKDSDTGNLVSLTSSAFKIKKLKDENGKDVRNLTEDESKENRLVDGYVTQKVNDKSYHVFMCASATDMDLEEGIFYAKDDLYGLTHTPLSLEPGEYQLEEWITSKGYITGNKLPFTIRSRSIVCMSADEKNSVEITFENKQLTGSLSFTKQIINWDAKDTSLLDYDLTKFGFTLYADEDIVSPDDGSVIVPQGKEAVMLTHDASSPYQTIGEVHPDENGNFSFTDLPLGKYVLKESGAKGYLTSQQAYQIEIKQSKFDQKVEEVEYEGEAPKVLPGREDYVDRSVWKDDVLITINGENTNSAKITNEVTKTSFSKKSIASQEELPGAHLSIRNSEGETLIEWISTKETYEIEGLPAGEYTLAEEAAPEGYFYSTEVPFTIKETSEIQTVEMQDAPIIYQIEKVDEEGNHVEGVTLSLLDITDPMHPVKIELPNQGVTTEAPFRLVGVLECEHLYELTEEEYVEGVYQACSLQFEVPKYSAETITVTMVDANTDVSIQKVDEASQPVKGAKLTVLKAEQQEDGSIVPSKDENGNVISVYEFVSDGEREDISQYVKGSNEVSGDVWYILRELKAPQGYETSRDIPFVVKGSRNLHQCIQMIDQRNCFNVSIQKTDASDAKKVLQGVEFTMYTKDGKIAKDRYGKDCVAKSDEKGMITWNFDGSQNISGYYIMETKALKGYQLNKKKYVISIDEAVSKKRSILFEIENRKITTVDTSQKTNIFAFAFTCSLALICAYLTLKFRLTRD